MLIKLTASGRNETIFVNFNYVRTMRRDGAFTELVMSDDKYHKLAVAETPDEIYDMLYPLKPCADNCNCHSTEAKMPEVSTATAETTPETTMTKKPATKKTAAKTVEEN